MRFCKRTYREDRRVFPSLGHKIALLAFLTFVALFPVLFGPYLVFVAGVCGVAVIGALSLNLLTGVTGLISLGHAAFLGIGAYTAAILSSKAGWPLIAVLPGAGVVAALCGAIVGIPALRLRGLYLVVTTLALQFITDHVIYHWESLTHGDKGIKTVAPAILGITLAPHQFYYVIVLLAGLFALFMKNLVMTRTGRAFVAIRDRDVAAEIIGIQMARYKIISFMTSSFMAGVAGALYAYLLGLINPDYFTFHQSILYAVMCLVGGMGTVLGSILGAVFMTLLPEVISAISGPIATAYPVMVPRIGAISVTVYGLVIIFFLLLEPRGLAGIWFRIRRYWVTWPFTY
jgi:branched-chain amino acid transport system permease protein